jgi:hypothetical protein
MPPAQVGAVKLEGLEVDPDRLHGVISWQVFADNLKSFVNLGFFSDNQGRHKTQHVLACAYGNQFVLDPTGFLQVGIFGGDSASGRSSAPCRAPPATMVRVLRQPDWLNRSNA